MIRNPILIATNDVLFSHLFHDFYTHHGIIKSCCVPDSNLFSGKLCVAKGEAQRWFEARYPPDSFVFCSVPTKKLGNGTLFGEAKKWAAPVFIFFS
jgi:hypothetical protein